MRGPGIRRRIYSLFTPTVGVVEVVAPKPAAVRGDLAVVAIIRDAAPRVVEWVEFHLLAGVAHLYVYDNLSIDGTAEVLAPFVARGVATVLPWQVDVTDASSGRWMSQQLLAYVHAIQTFGGSWRHMAFIDDDEFLVPSGEETLPAVLARLGHPSNLSLPWHMFGSAGHETPPEGGCIANYTRRALFALDKLVLNFKCIVDPTRVRSVSLHAFETADLGDRTMNTLGRIVGPDGRRSSDFLTSEAIQLNHYFTRSRSELADKIGRGDANGRSPPMRRKRILERAAAIERETVEDLTAVEFLARMSARAAD
ncbi:MAG: glycosyltransferase family 92 protein [Siculibacillus sp.]|nr:glycosyltransferase family 92 protein [Siculibacillus sp.]